MSSWVFCIDNFWSWIRLKQLCLQAVSTFYIKWKNKVYIVCMKPHLLVRCQLSAFFSRYFLHISLTKIKEEGNLIIHFIILHSDFLNSMKHLKRKSRKIFFYWSQDRLFHVGWHFRDLFLIFNLGFPHTGTLLTISAIVRPICTRTGRGYRPIPSPYRCVLSKERFISPFNLLPIELFSLLDRTVMVTRLSRYWFNFFL